MEEENKEVSKENSNEATVNEIKQPINEKPVGIPHNHPQGVPVELNVLIELVQNRIDYERLINVILINTELDYDGNLITKDNSKILDYISLIMPEFEKSIVLKTEELKKEKEK